jgi:uncharacterized protein (AIM24 family)
MTKSPQLLPTNSEGETHAGYVYHLAGELVPVLTVELQTDQSIYFEHHIMLWKHVSVDVRVRPMKGMLKRMIAGMQIFVTEAHGPGQVAFSRDGVGHIFGLHLQEDQELDVREHQFLAATAQIDYSFSRVKGIGNILFGGTGFFIDRFTARNAPGILWLHGYGNVFVVELNAGEQIDVEPGGWLFKDPTVQMEARFQRVATGFLASTNLVMNRFTGPGRLAIQSMYSHMPNGDDDG